MVLSARYCFGMSKLGSFETSETGKGYFYIYKFEMDNVVNNLGIFNVLD